MTLSKQRKLFVLYINIHFLEMAVILNLKAILDLISITLKLKLYCELIKPLKIFFFDYCNKLFYVDI